MGVYDQSLLNNPATRSGEGNRAKIGKGKGTVARAKKVGTAQMPAGGKMGKKLSANPMRSGVGSKVNTAGGDVAGKATGKVSRGSTKSSVARVADSGQRMGLGKSTMNAKKIKGGTQRTRITKATNGRGKAGGA